MKFLLNNDKENLNTSLPALYEFVENFLKTPSKLVVLFVTDTEGIIVREDVSNSHRLGRLEKLISRNTTSSWRRLPVGTTLNMVQE